MDDLPLIEPRATEPPQVSIRLVVSGLELRCRRGLDPGFRNDLIVLSVILKEASPMRMQDQNPAFQRYAHLLPKSGLYPARYVDVFWNHTNHKISDLEVVFIPRGSG